MTLLAEAAVLLVLQNLGQAPLQTPQVPRASIEGVVVRAGTGEPVSRARITANRTVAAGTPVQGNGTNPTSSVTADSQGRFTLKDLEPGTYFLTAQRNGFARQVYGERAPGRPGTPLDIVQGQAVKDIQFRLNPAGTISGRVSDAAGEPLPGITVQVLRSTYDQNGHRTFQTIGSARTDDRGEYRVYWLTPGRYYVNAAARSAVDNSSIAPNSNELLEPGYVTTYYPGTTDASTAGAVDLQSGVELNTIDFTMALQQLFRVRGRLVDARTGQPPRNAGLSITPKTPTGGVLTTFNGTSYNPANGGTFEFKDVAPGSYWIRATASPEPGAAIRVVRNSVQVAVDVSNADVENVVLAFTPGFTIKGRIELDDGASLSTLPNIDRTRVFLGPVESSPGIVSPQTIKEDGTFSLDDTQPGDYRVQVLSIPSNTYVKSARLGSVDILPGVSISGLVSDSIEIQLSTKGGEIDGVVVDKDEKPMRGVQAILIPDRQRDRRDLYKFGTTDQNGQFIMRTVAPGEYKLFAWEDLEPGAYNDPDILQKYEALAMPVKVSESAKVNIETKIIPAGP